MTGYDYIAQILKSEGVQWLACFPQTPMIEAAAAAGIRPIAFRHERGAVMAADGYSRTSGRRRFGVVAVQSQAGAENALGGLAQAAADNVPVLVLPAGNPRTAVTRPNFQAARTYRGVARQVEPVLRRDQLGAVMRRAVHGLRNGAPGPVVVELTADVCAQEIPPEERTRQPDADHALDAARGAGGQRSRPPSGRAAARNPGGRAVRFRCGDLARGRLVRRALAGGGRLTAPWSRRVGQ